MTLLPENKFQHRLLLVGVGLDLGLYQVVEERAQDLVVGRAVGELGGIERKHGRVSDQGAGWRGQNTGHTLARQGDTFGAVWTALECPVPATHGGFFARQHTRTKGRVPLDGVGWDGEGGLFPKPVAVQGRKAFGVARRKPAWCLVVLGLKSVARFGTSGQSPAVRHAAPTEKVCSHTL